MTKEAFERRPHPCRHFRLHQCDAASAGHRTRYGIELDCDMFDRMHRGARWLLDVRPAGRWPAAYVWYAGGVPRVMGACAICCIWMY
ncbi:MAG: hypothetical protein ACLR7U_00340 [Ruthenibacterium lactatiformans]